MATTDDLLAKIVADPADLGARMVYGDALVEAGDPRGELVVAQCTLAAAGIHGIDDLVDADVDAAELARLVAIQRRVEQLWQNHRKEWIAPLDLPEDTSVRFRRGMPEAIYTRGLADPARPVVPMIERLAKVTPISELHLLFHSNVTGLQRLVPLLGHVEELALETVDVTWEIVEELVAAAPKLRRLRLCQLRLDGAGLERLGRSPVMRQLERLDVGSTRGFGAAAIIDVVAAHPQLVMGVRRCDFTDADIATLVRKAPALRGIDLLDVPLGLDALRALVSLSSLRHLGFGSYDRDPQGLGQIIATGLAPLRGLKLGALDAKGMRAIAAAPHLAGLRSLQLERARLLKRGNQAIATLRELVHLNVPSETLHPEVDLSKLPLLVTRL